MYKYFGVELVNSPGNDGANIDPVDDTNDAPAVDSEIDQVVEDENQEEDQEENKEEDKIDDDQAVIDKEVD